MSRNNGRRGRRRERGLNIDNIVAPLDDLDLDNSSDSDDENFASFALLSTWMQRPLNFGVKSEPPNELTETILYTEDDIPINTIYVKFFQDPELITNEAVLKMFEQFGPIRSVRIHTNKHTNASQNGEEASGGARRWHKRRKNHANRYGFVNFKRCEDAAMCLHRKTWYKSQMILAPADSWHQEAYTSKMKKAEERDDSSGEVPLSGSINSNDSSNGHESEQDGMNILQLNDDCLRLIFEYLELKDLLALKKTCSRIENVTCDVLKRYKVVDFDIDYSEKKYLTMMDTKNILMEIGPYIEHLMISRDRFLKPSVRILSLIPRYCTNLKDLDINEFPLRANALKCFDELLKSLEGLTLTACGIDDSIGKSLKLATKLQRLDLSSNSEITGTCLTYVNNLKSLNLESCQNIQGKPFATFAAKNKTLEYLNISCCDRLTTEAIKSIATNMTSLRHLVCNNNYDNADFSSMALLCKLPNLIKIQFKINGYSSIDHMLRGIAEVNKLEHFDLSEGIYTPVDYELLCSLTHLKELKLNYKLDLDNEQLAKLCRKENFVELHIAGCTNVTDKQLIEFIRKNPQLKLLDISYCEITEGLIFSAIDILKQQAIGRREGDRQLKMMVGQTSICPVILNNTLVRANRHLLALSFESTEGFYCGVDADNMYDDFGDPDYDDDEELDYLPWEFLNNDSDPDEYGYYDGDYENFLFYLNLQ